MDGYLGNPVNDSVFGRSWAPRDLRGPAHPDVHGAAASGPYGISTTERYRAMTGAAEAPQEAPRRPAKGLTTDELAAGVEAFIAAAVSRVKGVGDEQYATSEGQKFESMSISELCDWTLEELEDVAVYAAMLAIRVR